MVPVTTWRSILYHHAFSMGIHPQKIDWAMASIANCWHNQRLLIWKITKRPPGVLPTTQLCLGETCPRFFGFGNQREKWTKMGKYGKSIHVVSHVHGKNIGNRWNCCGFVLQIAMTYQTFSGKIVRKLWWTLMNHLYTSPQKKGVEVLASSRSMKMPL